MDADALLTGLQEHLPLRTTPYDIHGKAVGLVVVDEVNGFCAVGGGNLAPAAPDAQIKAMVARTDALARAFVAGRRPILAFLDTHAPDVPEPPYPPHCVKGTGEENLVPELRWLEDEPDATLIRKDCINGFVGGIEATFKGHGLSHNKTVDWVNRHRLEAVLVVGICTDVCVMDFVLTMLSARNHRLMPTLADIVVVEPATATYDLPKAAAAGLGLPETAGHPKAPTHHMGLYFMASRGAVLADEVEGLG